MTILMLTRCKNLKERKLFWFVFLCSYDFSKLYRNDMFVTIIDTGYLLWVWWEIRLGIGVVHFHF